MVTVRVLKNVFGTGFGSVRRGNTVEVSEQTAREWIAKGIAEPMQSTERKAAPVPNNKMAPPPRNKAKPAKARAK